MEADWDAEQLLILNFAPCLFSESYFFKVEAGEQMMVLS